MKFDPAKYFDVVIQGDSFYISETGEKPKNLSAVSTLAKIEEVVKRGLKYSNPSHKDDEYAKMSEIELLNLLKGKAAKIHKGYSEKVGKIHKVRRYFTEAKQVAKMHARIDDLVSPTLPTDVVALMASYLPIENLGEFAELDKGQAPVVKLVHKYGYQGKDGKEAARYLKELCEEIEKFSKQDLLPKKCLYYDTKGRLDPEMILRNLIDPKTSSENLSVEDLFNLFCNKKVYAPSFQKIRKLFAVKGNWEGIEKPDSKIKQAGERALLLAAFNRDKDALESLLKQGVDPDCASEQGFTALHSAANEGWADMVELLLKANASVDKLTSDGVLAALICACGSGVHAKPNAAVVKLLLDHHADPNIANKLGQTPLHFAVHRGWPEIVELLLKNGAFANERDAYGSTALLRACGGVGECEPNVALVKLLLEHNAYPDIASKSGKTPLHWAVIRGSPEIVKLLLEKDALLIKARDTSGYTPLFYACGAEGWPTNPAIIKLLLKHNADPYDVAYDGSTPTIIAYSTKRVDVIAALSNPS